MTRHTGFRARGWLLAAPARCPGHRVRRANADKPIAVELAGGGELGGDFRGDVHNPDTVTAAVRSARPQVVFDPAAPGIARTRARAPRRLHSRRLHPARQRTRRVTVRSIRVVGRAGRSARRPSANGDLDLVDTAPPRGRRPVGGPPQGIQRAPVPSLASRHGCRPGGEPREGCPVLAAGLDRPVPRQL
jgi:hypothetical protein